MPPNSSAEQPSNGPGSVYITKPRVPTPKKPPSQQQKQESVPKSATPLTSSTEQPSAGPGSVYITKPHVPTPKVPTSQQPTPKVPTSQQPTPKVPPSQQKKQQSGPGSAKPSSQQQKQQSGPGSATPPTSSTEQPPAAPGSVYVTKPRVPTQKTLPPHCPICPYVPKEVCPDASHQHPATSSPPSQPVSQPKQGSDAAAATPASVTSLDQPTPKVPPSQQQKQESGPRSAKPPISSNQQPTSDPGSVYITKPHVPTPKVPPSQQQSSEPRDPNKSVYLMPM